MHLKKTVKKKNILIIENNVRSLKVRLGIFYIKNLSIMVCTLITYPVIQEENSRKKNFVCKHLWTQPGALHNGGKTKKKKKKETTLTCTLLLVNEGFQQKIRTDCTCSGETVGKRRLTSSKVRRTVTNTTQSRRAIYTHSHCRERIYKHTHTHRHESWIFLFLRSYNGRKNWLYAIFYNTRGKFDSPDFGNFKDGEQTDYIVGDDICVLLFFAKGREKTKYALTMNNSGATIEQRASLENTDGSHRDASDAIDSRGKHGHEIPTGERKWTWRGGRELKTNTTRLYTNRFKVSVPVHPKQIDNTENYQYFFHKSVFLVFFQIHSNSLSLLALNCQE